MWILSGVSGKTRDSLLNKKTDPFICHPCVRVISRLQEMKLQTRNSHILASSESFYSMIERSSANTSGSCFHNIGPESQPSCLQPAKYCGCY